MEPTLKDLQDAGTAVERRLMEFLLQFTPAENLSVAHVQCIARNARSIAFDEYRKLQPETY